MRNSNEHEGTRQRGPANSPVRPILASGAIGVAIVAALSFTRLSHQAPETNATSAMSVGAVAQAQDTPGDCQVYVLHHNVADEQYIRWVGPWAQSIRCSRAQTPEPGFVETGHHAQATFFGGGGAPHDGDWRSSSEAGS
jgi:hypothetical protein